MTFKLKNGIQVGANVAIDSNALLQQIEATPSIRPSLMMDFARSKTVDGRATFTRSSNATYYGQDGYIRAASANQPRIEYSSNAAGQCEGLLIEETRTNLLQGTEQFGEPTYWPQSNTFNTPAPYVTAPDGTQTAFKIIEDTGTGEHALRYPATLPISTNAQYTFTLFVKAGERSQFDLLIGGASNWVNANRTAAFDLVANTVSVPGAPANGSIQSIGNGWFRCRITATTNAISTSATSVNLRIYNNVGTGSYTGDGASGLYVWGAQFEAGAFPTSYIPPSLTFTSRSSNATYQDNADGLLKYATSNVVRYNYNPVTRANTSFFLEPAATNILTYSETVGPGAALTVTNNTAVAPTGTTIATTCTEDTSSGVRHYIGYGTSAITANSVNTGSVYLKAGTRTKVYVTVGMAGSPYTRAGAIIDLSTGAYSAYNIATPVYSYTSVQYVANGWYRVAVSALTNATDTTMYMEVGGADASNNTTYTGTSSTFYAWGAQFETGYGATSYIPTNGTAVTRAADVYSSPNSTRASESLTIPQAKVNLKPFEGTASFEGKVDGDIDTNQYLYGFGDGSTNALISHRVITSGRVDFVTWKDNVQTSAVSNYTASDNTVFKTAASFSNSLCVSYFNGVNQGSSNPSNGIPKYTTITVGGGYGTGMKRGYIRNFTYYPKVLSNTELSSITSS